MRASSCWITWCGRARYARTSRATVPSRRYGACLSEAGGRTRRASIAVATHLIADHAADDAADRRTADVTGHAGTDRRAHAGAYHGVTVALAHARARREVRGQERTDHQFGCPFHRRPP